jgi:serine protease inhibitor
MMRLTFLLTVFIAIVSCDKNSTPIDPVAVTEVQQIADMNQKFGWEVFHREMAAKPGENILISPWSIQTALQMANNGAQANTLNELLAALHCPDCSVTDINTQQAKLTTLLEQQSGHPKLTSANVLFYDTQRVELFESFKQPLSDNFKTAFETANFDNVPSALESINNWVKTNTNGKIDKILDNITQEDIAFLINALHFKADWSSPFPEQSTSDRDFSTATGQVVKVPMMSHDWDFTFAEGAKLRMVDLPFKDSTYSLTLLQPSLSNSANDWYKEVNTDALKALYAASSYERAIVQLPRFKMSYENDLIETLKYLGVRDAFSDGRADFGKLGKANGNIFINQIRHKAVLEVDEKGAEGAAVTSVGFGVTSVPPVFYFNKPFVLVLRHLPTNTLIFTGYLANPLQ